MEYGTIRIKLDELLKESGLSKNMLSHRAEMQRTQINNYCRNQITRLDIDVLARLCTVLNCEIDDLLEFVPPEERMNETRRKDLCSNLRVFCLVRSNCIQKLYISLLSLCHFPILRRIDTCTLFEHTGKAPCIVVTNGSSHLFNRKIC